MIPKSFDDDLKHNKTINYNPNCVIQVYAYFWQWLMLGEIISSAITILYGSIKSSRAEVSFDLDFPNWANSSERPQNCWQSTQTNFRCVLEHGNDLIGAWI